MDCEEGPSSSAQPRARRRARCPLPITSLLGGRISRMRGPLSRLGITDDDPENPGGAVGPEMVKFDESPAVSNDRESTMIPGTEARSVSAVATGSLRFDSEMIRNPKDSEFNARLSDDTEILSDPTPGGLRFASHVSASDPLNFPPDAYGERYSTQSDISGVRKTSSPDIGNCKRSHGIVGRDTMGSNFFVNSSSRCPEDNTCYEECGYGTGCDAQCRLEHGVKSGSIAVSDVVPQIVQTGMGAEPGGAMPMYSDFQRGFAAPGGPGGYSGGPGGYSGGPGGYSGGPGGYNGRSGGYTGGHPDGRYRSCPEACGLPDNHGGGQLNFYVMLLLEIFGVLIFFAICTITFWITLGYHVVRLMVELKNADRNVQVAVAIVFGLLFLAFVICHVTNGSGSNCRACERSRGHWTRAGSGSHRRSKAKSTSTSPITMILTQIKKVLSFGGGSSSRQPSSSCGAKKASAPCRRKPRYSDCEGRAIFISSRRYAIPTEMKQPPTIVLWLLSVLGRFMS